MCIAKARAFCRVAVLSVLMLLMTACTNIDDPHVSVDDPKVISTVCTSTDGETTIQTTGTMQTTTSKKTANTMITTKPSKTKATATSGTKTTAPTAEKKKTVNGSSKKPNTWVYQLVDSGLAVREARFDSGKGGDPAVIVDMTDMHLGDFPKSIENTQRCMNYAASYDQTVITGDTINYISQTQFDLLQRMIWDNDPTALVVLGNHDTLMDTATIEQRYQMVQDVWKHNVYYTSKVIKNKAMVIQLDNSLGYFWPEQVSQLKEDIEIAHKNGYVVLIFIHMALRTNNPTYDKCVSFYPSGTAVKLGTSGVYNSTPATEEVYSLLTDNADVVKGVFAGHVHANYYMEINAKTSDGKDAVIPQYILSPVYSDNGMVMKITVD